MKYLDLFSGIGGFALPLSEAGHSCVGYSEIDKYALEVYARHFPDHNLIGDITKVDELNLPDFDLLVGGFPCQSFSIAGKRGGFEDTRGTLFFEIARILKAKRPKWFVLENVRGLISHDNGNTLGTIMQTLWELDYAVDYKVLNSKNFGVPQNRERVFIVGLRTEDCGTVKEFWHFDYPKGAPPIVCLRDIMQDKVAKKYFLKPASVAKLIEYTERNQANGNGFGAKFHDPSGIMSTIKVGGDGADNLVQVGVIGKDSQAFRVYSPEGISSTLASQAGGLGAKTGLYEIEKKKIRKLTPVECARLQGFPDDWCSDLSDTQAYRCYGNAVTTNVIRAIIPKLVN